MNVNNFKILNITKLYTKIESEMKKDKKLCAKA